MTPGDKSEAFQRGYATGLEDGTQAADCPIGHDEVDERMDWMNGFGAARDERPPSTAGAASDTSPPFLHEG